ncbi:MAG: MFS transporter, partial [Rubrivivax sp.]
NDFLVFGTVATASFSSGRLLNTSGWDTLNWLMLPLLAAVLLMLGWLAWRERRPALAAR